MDRKAFTQHHFFMKSGTKFTRAFKSGAGFTLIELIIEIALIALIAAAVFVAINPGKRIGEAKDAVRAGDALAIEKAIQKSIANNLTIPSGLNGLAQGTYYMLVTDGGSTSGTHNCATLDESIARSDVTSDFTNFIGEIPVDGDASGDDTGYYIKRTMNHYECGHCNAYGDTYVADAPSGPSLLSVVYELGGLKDFFHDVYSDGTYTYAVGSTQAEGQGSDDALIVKFNSDLSIAARKVYGGASTDSFRDVYSDGTYIYAVGNTQSEGAGSTDALIVKFNSDLSIAARKVYGDSTLDNFYGVYSDGTYTYAVGYTNSEGVGNYDGLIVKFNSDLSIAARKVYGGASYEHLHDVYSDGTYIYIVGDTASEGQEGYDALIVKFNSDLSIAARKVYGGASGDYFYGVHSDGTYTYAVGMTGSEGQGEFDALIVKFNSDLSIAARKVYGRTSSATRDSFTNVYSDGTYIYTVGYTRLSDYDGLMVKFNSDLSINSEKLYGDTIGTIPSQFFESVHYAGAYVWAAGYNEKDPWSDSSGLIVRINDWPSGSDNTDPAGFVWEDASFTLDNSDLILDNSAMTLADSAMTLADSAMTLADSGLDYTTYTIE
ncbi:hypothetical protein K8R42_01200 [bacterium]|nr:hypothetical protein [bacterium]